MITPTTKSSESRRRQAIHMTKHLLGKALASGSVADMEHALAYMNDQSASIPFEWKLKLVSTIQAARHLEEAAA